MADKSINYVYGGPAFPIVYRDESKPGVISQEIHVGMQLRDYFAAQALNGFLSGFKHPQSISASGMTAGMSAIRRSRYALSGV